jgi:hypothetical protein
MGKKGGRAKSARGLAMSARNSRKHGLLSRSNCVLHNEDEESFALLRNQFYAVLAPTNAVELSYAERVIESAWRLQRINDLESEAYRIEIEKQRGLRSATPNEPSSGPVTEASVTYLALEKLTVRNPTFVNLQRYRTSIERSFTRFHRAYLALRTGSDLTNPLPLDPSLPVRNSVFKEFQPSPHCETNLTSSFQINKPSSEPNSDSEAR